MLFQQTKKDVQILTKKCENAKLQAIGKQSKIFSSFKNRDCSEVE